MNPEYENQLEHEIDQELKALPQLHAPSTLAARVLRSIERRRVLPWFKRPWTAWPLASQVASLALLLSAFGGLSFGSLGASEVAANVVSEKFGVWFATLRAVGEALGTVIGAFQLLIAHLGPGFVLGCVAAVVLGYALCVALGTVFVRLGMSRPGRF
ncbi:MAG TPA: hypothetical protein VLT36_10285 [Candidatus Dormibacteraeota bacterium]|nr:hypothetical protein [Candidatus Dormibacteraeota bacterium]